MPGYYLNTTVAAAAARALSNALSAEKNAELVYQYAGVANANAQSACVAAQRGLADAQRVRYAWDAIAVLDDEAARAYQRALSAEHSASLVLTQSRVVAANAQRSHTVTRRNLDAAVDARHACEDDYFRVDAAVARDAAAA